jgi:hypothetical protein
VLVGQISEVSLALGLSLNDELKHTDRGRLCSADVGAASMLQVEDSVIEGPIFNFTGPKHDS